LISTTVLGTFATVDAASLGAAWLNTITADLSAARIARGQALIGTSALPPAIFEPGPRRNTRFFFILSARL
jgi:hypothetical protein